MPQTPERREHERAKRLLRFEFSQGERAVRALSSNVSSCGAFLCAGTLPERGEDVLLRFNQTADPRQSVIIKARVVRCVQSPDGAEPNRGFAVHWLEASTKGDKAAIDSFLAQFSDEPRGDAEEGPGAGDLGIRHRFVFAPLPTTADAARGGDGAIVMGNGGIAGPIELSLDDFLRQEDFDDDEEATGPPTIPVGSPPDLFDDTDERGLGKDELNQLFIGTPRNMSGVTPPEMPAARLPPRPNLAPASAPAVGPPREALPRPTFPTTPPPPVRRQRPTGPRGARRLPDDEEVGSALLSASLPVRLEWSGYSEPAQTVHISKTQLNVAMNGPPPSVYSRVAVFFPSSGSRKAARVPIWTNVTRVRDSAHGPGIGGLVSLRVAMQNAPRTLKGYREIVKRAEKAVRPPR